MSTYRRTGYVIGFTLLGFSSLSFAASVQKMAIVSAAQNVAATACSSAVLVQAQDGSSKPAKVSKKVRIYFTGSSPSLKTFMDAGCKQGISSIVMNSGTNKIQFYFSGSKAGAQKLVVATYDYTDSSQSENILSSSSTPPTTTSTTTTTVSSTTSTTVVSSPSTTLPLQAGRVIPSPIYGVTLDDISNISGELASLKQIARMPTARVVFDSSEKPAYYSAPLQQLRAASYIMGQILDSSDMAKYSVSTYQTRAENYMSALKNQVDVWEIGNEINGGWLGQSPYQQALAAFNVVNEQGGATALTFFYEGEPSDPRNCIDTSGDGNDMFSWINEKFQLDLPASQRDPANEKFRLGLSYVLISWYPSQCNNIQPDWSAIYSELARIFPNSKLGFGEIGTPNPQNGSAYEQNLINQFYPMANTMTLPSSYIGGYFWWYYAEEMVPATKTPLFNVLNNAILQGP